MENEKSGAAPHSVSSYDRELSELVGRVSSMGELILEQLRNVHSALSAFDAEAAAAVAARDAEVNGWEVLIDRTIEEICARRQPAAADLRLLLGISRAASDLERMGDEIRNIARTVARVGKPGKFAQSATVTLSASFSTAGIMIADALEALRARDARLAREVIARDELIDGVFRTVMEQVTDQIRQGADARGSIALGWIAKTLERIGDHAKNVAEAVVYICEGADIRHEFYTDKYTLLKGAADH